MADKKHYTRTKTIDGVKYTAQFSGLSLFLNIYDDTHIGDSKNISTSKLAKEIFAHVIVDPAGLTVDDFEDMETLNEVVNFGTEVAQGKFRDKPDQSAADPKGKG